MPGADIELCLPGILQHLLAIIYQQKQSNIRCLRQQRLWNQQLSLSLFKLNYAKYNHHVLRRKIVAQPAWILLHRKQLAVNFHKHFLWNAFYNSTTRTTAKCLPNNSNEKCLRLNKYYCLENATAFEDIITFLVEWSCSLWHAKCIELKAIVTERLGIETFENKLP